MMWAYFFIPCLVYGFVEAAYSSERNNLRRECPGQAERHGSTTCVRTPCRSGTKFSCMIKDGQPYKACGIQTFTALIVMSFSVGHPSNMTHLHV
uniref:Secreted protein n=1 Tax=Rhipicephalus appendiculatus TaxID=34631 RepID=A0A131YGU3_RHIAP